MADEMNGERETFPEGITRDETVHGQTYYTAADMAWASAKGFENARASLAANAGSEPVAWAIFADGGNIRLWSKKPLLHPSAQPLYTHPSPPEGMAGWKWVPVEPTEEMKAAAVKYANGTAVYKNVKAEVLRIEEGIYGEVYEAMIAAAPPLPASEAKGATE